ncbi:MAG: YihY/virulence factor BrkB family protein [Paracoccus sp. (in: a-proteobacteria)]|uniref:YihY/virulence factor BrkB family protein n=1 Tax=Paracoccus sp. TaxID=267 RepID=UPI0026E0DA7E|nr:YihY/virulence factor BrkB family protein [Paracoccus sp. (in: a-proteobacteria)]MDO5620187.1 YihY/virulence factor BrkB family protein [Paracoccus sp. (in: a-proteobacteria)]
MSGPRSISDAIFGPLDDDTRRRFGLLHDPAPDLRTQEQAQIESAGGPQSGWQLDRTDWLAVGKRSLAAISKDRVTSVAGGVTFFGLLSLFPAITALVSIYAVLADPMTIDSHLQGLSHLLPEGAMQIISGQVNSIAAAPKNALSAAGAVAILLALYSAMGGIKALLEALNIAWFQPETRGFFQLNLVAFLFTIGAIGLIIALIGLVAVLPLMLSYLPLGGGTVTGLRWPLMFGALILALAVLYRWGPSRHDATWQWITPGALIASVGLIAASLLFSWYAANFANYNQTYGSLGAAIGLMMWLWIAAIVVMVGAEVNSEIERQVRIRAGLPVPDSKD